jgi:hypothetical protein
VPVALQRMQDVLSAQHLFVVVVRSAARAGAQGYANPQPEAPTATSSQLRVPKEVAKGLMRVALDALPQLFDLNQMRPRCPPHGRSASPRSSQTAARFN